MQHLLTIIHHTAGNLTLKQINDLHKYQGYPKSSLGYYVGYHRVIFKDGSMVQTRLDNEIGAHVKDANLGKVGIALVGDLTKEAPTDCQIETLFKQLKAWGKPVKFHRDFNQTACPGFLTLFTFKVRTFNAPLNALQALRSDVERFSKGRIALDIQEATGPEINLIPPRLLTHDEVVPMLTDDRCNIVFYQSNLPSVFASTSYLQVYPYIIADVRVNPLSLAFEVSHALQKFYNTHRGSLDPVEILDIFTPSEALVQAKFDSVTPLLPLIEEPGDQIMTEQEVKLWYLASFNRLPDSGELAFWVGKPSVELARTIIIERAKFLTEQAQQN